MTDETPMGQSPDTRRDLIPEKLWAALHEVYALDWHGIHGLAHWQRVRDNGLRLAEVTGANPRVIKLFAFIHDIRRQNDGHDPQHGARAAEWARSTVRHLIDLDDADFEVLAYACAHHTDGTHHPDVTICTCWDADRLDLGRVGIRPDPCRLCTTAAREPEILAWAIGRSYVGRGT